MEAVENIDKTADGTPVEVITAEAVEADGSEAVEATPAEATSTDLVVLSSEDLAVAQLRLDLLTTEVREAIVSGAASFVRAADTLSTIKAENLVEDTTDLTFEEYCEQQFGISKDYANKLTRGGKVVKAIESAPTKAQREKIAGVMPSSEGQIRPLAKVLTGKNGGPKVVAKVWAAAVSESKKRGAFSTPSQSDVEKAITKLAPDLGKRKPNGSTRPSTTPVVNEDEGVEKPKFAKSSPEGKLLKLRDVYGEVTDKAFAHILLEGFKLASKMSENVLRDDLKSAGLL